MKIISSSTDEDIERERLQREQERTSGEFNAAARALASNLLRLVRGSGAGYRITRQIEDLRAALVDFREAHKALPSEQQWQIALSPDEVWKTIRPGIYQYREYSALDEEGRLHQATDEAAESVCAAALQRQASRLAGQIPQEATAARDLSEALTEFTEARQKRNEFVRLKYLQPKARKKSKSPSGRK